MDRETKFRWVLILAAAAITAMVMVGLYTVRPIQIYQVPAAPTTIPVVEESSPPGEVIPVEGDAIPVESEPEESGPQEVLVEKSINLNTATVEELDQLPGVGPVIAQRIVDYRQQNQGFYDIQELMEVSGIGEKTFAKLEPYITVE